MVSSQTINIIQQLILLPRQWRLRPLNIAAKLSSKPRKLKAKLSIADGFGYVAVDHSEYFYVFLKYQCFKEAGCLLIKHVFSFKLHDNW